MTLKWSYTLEINRERIETALTIELQQTHHYLELPCNENQKDSTFKNDIYVNPKRWWYSGRRKLEEQGIRTTMKKKEFRGNAWLGKHEYCKGVNIVSEKLDLEKLIY